MSRQFTQADFRLASELLRSFDYDVVAVRQLVEFANAFRGHEIGPPEPTNESTSQGAERQDASWFYQESEDVGSEQEAHGSNPNR